MHNESRGFVGLEVEKYLVWRCNEKPNQSSCNIARVVDGNNAQDKQREVRKQRYQPRSLSKSFT